SYIKGPTALFVDNFPVHVSATSKSIVCNQLCSIIVPLPPRSTSTCQSLDVGVMGPFKAKLRALWMKKMLNIKANTPVLTLKEKRCPKLQKLWLSHNHIKSIANLEPCCDLRELWLQDNQIQQLGNSLSRLTNLHSLALAKNQISHFEELSNLVHLPHLCSLSLHDEHYGSNPITLATGYKIYVMNQLPQIRVLDGLEISPNDQNHAQDTYLQRVLAFNDRIDQIQQDHERAMAAIDTRRNHNASHADMLQQELVSAFKSLEDVIRRGRENISKEHTRQELLREKYTTLLHNTLQSIQDDYITQLDDMIAAESNSAKDTDMMFEILEQRLAAEEIHIQTIMYLQRTFLLQRLTDSTPEFRFAASLFLRPLQSEHDKLKILQIYKCHNAFYSTELVIFHAKQAKEFFAYYSNPWLAIAMDKHNDQNQARHHEIMISRKPENHSLFFDFSNLATTEEVVYEFDQRQEEIWIYFPNSTESPLEVLSLLYHCLCFETPSFIDESKLKTLASSISYDLFDEDLTNAHFDQSYDGRIQQAVSEYKDALWNDLEPKKQKGNGDSKRVLLQNILQEQEAQKLQLRQQIQKGK
ncbi:hypothetical protein THRCLA_09742, partial [Thraustotheca clavata]